VCQCRSTIAIRKIHAAGGSVKSLNIGAIVLTKSGALEEEALIWATELDLAGYGTYVWKRLRIIASEDMGLADPNVCVQVRPLYENWIELRRKREDFSFAERLFFVHAVLLCVRAKETLLPDPLPSAILGGSPKQTRAHRMNFSFFLQLNQGFDRPKQIIQYAWVLDRG
jgi:hypothetical protein